MKRKNCRTTFAKSLVLVSLLFFAGQMGWSQDEQKEPKAKSPSTRITSTEKSAAGNDKALSSSSPSNAPAKEWKPPFPERREFFEPPKIEIQQAKQAAQPKTVKTTDNDGKVKEETRPSVVLKGFVEVEDEPLRVVLDIAGKLKSLEAGESHEKVELAAVDFDAKTVTLTWGRHRWSTTLNEQPVSGKREMPQGMPTMNAANRMIGSNSTKTLTSIQSSPPKMEMKDSATMGSGNLNGGRVPVAGGPPSGAGLPGAAGPPVGGSLLGSGGPPGGVGLPNGGGMPGGGNLTGMGGPPNIGAVPGSSGLPGGGNIPGGGGIPSAGGPPGNGGPSINGGGSIPGVGGIPGGAGMPSGVGIPGGGGGIPGGNGGIPGGNGGIPGGSGGIPGGGGGLPGGAGGIPGGGGGLPSGGGGLPGGGGGLPGGGGPGMPGSGSGSLPGGGAGLPGGSSMPAGPGGSAPGGGGIH